MKLHPRKRRLKNMNSKTYTIKFFVTYPYKSNILCFVMFSFMLLFLDFVDLIYLFRTFRIVQVVGIPQRTRLGGFLHHFTKKVYFSFVSPFIFGFLLTSRFNCILYSTFFFIFSFVEKLVEYTKIMLETSKEKHES